MAARAEMMPGSDRELVLQAVAGDRGALATLLKSHERAVRGAIGSSIPTRWQSVLGVDDVVQETYTDAFLHIHDFEPRDGASFEGWLVTIARNNLRAALRMLEADKRGGDRRRVEPDAKSSHVALCDLLADTTTRPSGKAVRVESVAMLTKAIARLPTNHRMVVKRYDLEGRGVGDVAVELNRSPGAVFMLRARAHRTLQRLMGIPADFFTDG